MPTETVSRTSPPAGELPARVPEAAAFLGVSPQTAYLWVERKQIPHFRMMGRSIRFMLSELDRPGMPSSGKSPRRLDASTCFPAPGRTGRSRT